MIQISEPVTLEKLLPLIQELTEGERKRLRESLIEHAESECAAGLPGETVSGTLTVEVRKDFEVVLAAVKDEPEIEHERLRQSLDNASRLDAAILFYQEGVVTFGKAANLAGIHRFELDEVFAERGIWKIVEVRPAEELKAGVELIKRLRESTARTEAQ